ncbi:MAG: hypothetical protein JJU20_03385 [Opitutales bacterium]|nr:hypothetical protein [Opitutales bacterium]
MNTAVAFIIFRRPDCTQRVFERIRQARPPRLYVIADGARREIPEEAEKVAAARSAVEIVDWPCTVTRIYSDTNLGCRDRVVTGLDAVFAKEEQAIILEDDTLPNLAFFDFCEVLLYRFSDHDTVASIIGSNFLWGRSGKCFSYFTSRHFVPWGWATWRHRWKQLDLEATSFPEWESNTSSRSRIFPIADRYWHQIFSRIHAEGSSTSSWDYPWTFTHFANNWTCLQPTINLVTNIGFGQEATNCDQVVPVLSAPNPEPKGELIHPEPLREHPEWDKLTFFAHCHHREIRPWHVFLGNLRVRLGRFRQELGKLIFRR